MLNVKLLSVAALGLALAATGCASRDSDNRMGGRAAAQADAGHHGMMGGPRSMADRVEGHLAFLKAELKITAAQEPRWNTFATAMRDHARTMGDMMRTMPAPRRGASLPERLEGMEHMMTMHRDEMRKLSPAVKGLYGSLTAAQKRTADELLGHMGGMPMMMMMGGGRGMAGMMGGPGGDRVEGRIAQLRTELKITPAQEPQFNALAAEMRAQSRAMGQMHAQMMGGQGGRGGMAGMNHDGAAPARGRMNMSAPAMLDEHDKMMTAHLDALRKFRTAAAALYATLTPAQKQIADELMGRGGRRMRGPMH